MFALLSVFGLLFSLAALLITLLILFDPLFQGPTVDFTDPMAVLLWLAAAGSPYFFGKIFAYIAENFQCWHDQVFCYYPLFASSFTLL